MAEAEAGEALEVQEEEAGVAEPKQRHAETSWLGDADSKIDAVSPTPGLKPSPLTPMLLPGEGMLRLEMGAVPLPRALSKENAGIA